jgi:C4-dicarboxylate-specific signal transduction histidine kinase
MSSSFDSIYRKMASSLESVGAGHMHEAKIDTARHISPGVAHELNNLLTIIQGYADRLLLKHGENPAIEANLKLISEASRRAATLVRSAMPSEADLPVRPQPNPPPLVPAA